jgi:hypothetical protein
MLALSPLVGGGGGGGVGVEGNQTKKSDIYDTTFIGLRL